MSELVLICTDGSDLAIDAARRGVALLHPDATVVVAAVAETIDASLLAGSSGFAGGVMSGEQIVDMQAQHLGAAEETVAATKAAIGRPDAETRVVEGPAGAALCELAAALGAATMVVGSRGHGGIRRAFLGSTSDYIVRNAPCPVLVVRELDEPDDD